MDWWIFWPGFDCFWPDVDRFWPVLTGSDRFWPVLIGSDQKKVIWHKGPTTSGLWPVHWPALWPVRDRFWHAVLTGFDKVLTNFDRFWPVLTGSDRFPTGTSKSIFWPVLKPVLTALTSLKALVLTGSDRLTLILTEFFDRFWSDLTNSQTGFDQFMTGVLTSSWLSSDMV